MDDAEETPERCTKFSQRDEFGLGELISQDAPPSYSPCARGRSTLAALRSLDTRIVLRYCAAMRPKSSPGRVRGDFTANHRLIGLSLLALGVGALCAAVAAVLLRLIALFTNLFYFHRLSSSAVSPAGNTLGVWSILVPIAGGLVIGLMARYGSERIRGHGIPEALEAILIGRSRMDPKVAVLKPLASAVSIGSGGPFGAEGPIIMTGGAIGSILAQAFHLTAAERKTLLVAGAAGGMSATFATPVAAVL
ncbi:MAG: chloride channel protein, partial [Candidatus Eisenbacteria bacterium]